ncbi:MAG: sulfatase-like hydrolase/transferase [Elusimicrobiota bacterium]|nr:sulfatase-like hydrolase/transferase [Elusimicrobiota bacterium]
MKLFKDILGRIFLSQYENDIKLKVRISLFYVCFLLIVFACFRLLFCLVYPDAFASLSFLEKLKAFAFGLRFDINIVGIFVGYFIAAMFLPIADKQKLLIKIFTVLMTISTLVILLFLCGDFFYFPQVRRHMSEEIIMAYMEKGLIIRYAFENYWHILLVLFGGVLLLIRAQFKFINKRFLISANPKLSLFKSLGIFLCVGCALFLSVRASFGDRAINPNQVFSMTNSFESAQLMLNGVFTQYQFLMGVDRQNEINQYPFDKAVKNAQKLLLSENEIIADENYPLMRRNKNAKKFENYNVVIILLESWTPYYIDSLNDSAGRGMAKFKVTSNFDAIVRDSIVFSNAYANGLGSLFGISASLTGIPLMPGMVYNANSIDATAKKTALADEFNKRGYFTMFAQSDNRESMQMADLAKNMLKFQESYGLEDIPLKRKYENDIPTGYDFEMLDFAAQKAAAARKKARPFFMYLFTGSTHVPFFSTTKEFEKYPADSMENKYLNTLYYADKAIGNFMDIAKKEGYFDDTIFIFMADHTQGYTRSLNGVLERFRIPFIIYAPKILQPKNIKWTVSQSDLMATIYHIMNFDGDFSDIGVNALDESANHFALLNDGANIILIDGSDYIRHNRETAAESSLNAETERFQTMQENLLSLDKAITGVFKKNKWYK